MMVDEHGRDRKRSMSLSPKLNPLDAFIGEDVGDEDFDEGEAIDGVAHNGQKADKGSMANDFIPLQRPSIINERATVRYYRDLTRTPLIFSQGQQGTASLAASDLERGAGRLGDDYLDVSLLLDMTTGCGGKIWPAAEVLGQYIAAKRSDGQWTDKTIVELGSGTGLVGLLAAKLAGVKQVWITDQIPMMHLMKQNLALNPELEQVVAVEELNWGEAIPPSVPKHPDVLLLADCVYLEVAFQPLVDTMCEMSTAKTEILFCYQQRRKADKRFFKMLKKHFSFEDVQDDDDVRRKQYNRQGTHLYRMVRREKAR